VLTVYAPVLLFGTLPWTGSIVRGIARGVRRLRNANWRGAAASAPHATFLLIWTAVPLAVFLLARSRMELYLLPLFAPLALVAARTLERVGTVFTRRRVIALGCWVVLMLGLRVLSGTLPFSRDARAFARALDGLGVAAYHEAVFVDTQPYLGLSLYLDFEVEEVALDSELARQSVADELGEPDGDREEPRLWIVPTDKSDGFLALCDESAYRVRLLGNVETKRSYRVYGGQPRASGERAAAPPMLPETP